MIVEKEGKKYLDLGDSRFAEIESFTPEGVPVLKTTIVQNDVYPKRSVEVKVQCVTLGAQPGNN
jgi:hypothetical protein